MFCHWQIRAVVLPNADTFFSSWAHCSSYLKKHILTCVLWPNKERKKSKFSLKVCWNKRTRYQIPLTFCVIYAAQHFTACARDWFMWWTLLISFPIAEVKGLDIFHRVATVAPTPWKDLKHRKSWAASWILFQLQIVTQHLRNRNPDKEI